MSNNSNNSKNNNNNNNHNDIFHKEKALRQMLLSRGALDN